MIKTFAAGTFLLMLGTAATGAMDLKDLIPCRSAAVRLCDKTQGMCKRRSNYPSLKRPGIPVAPE